MADIRQGTMRPGDSSEFGDGPLGRYWAAGLKAAEAWGEIERMGGVDTLFPLGDVLSLVDAHYEDWSSPGFFAQLHGGAVVPLDRSEYNALSHYLDGHRDFVAHRFRCRMRRMDAVISAPGWSSERLEPFFTGEIRTAQVADIWSVILEESENE